MVFNENGIVLTYNTSIDLPLLREEKEVLYSNGHFYNNKLEQLDSLNNEYSISNDTEPSLSSYKKEIEYDQLNSFYWKV